MNKRVCLVFLLGIFSLAVGEENRAYFSSTQEYFLAYEVEKCLDIHSQYTIVHDNFTQTFYSDPDCTDEVLSLELREEEWSYDSVAFENRFEERLELFMDDQCTDRVAEVLFDLEKCFPSLWTNLNSIKWRITNNGLHSDFWFNSDGKTSCPAVPARSTRLFFNSCEFEKDFGAYYYYDREIIEPHRAENGGGKNGGSLLLSLVGVLVGVMGSYGMGGKYSRVMGILVVGLCLSTCVSAQGEEGQKELELHNRTSRADFRSGYHDDTLHTIPDQVVLDVKIHYYTTGLENGNYYNGCDPCKTQKTRGLCHAGVRIEAPPYGEIYFDYGFEDGTKVGKDQPASLMIARNAGYKSIGNYKECRQYKRLEEKFGAFRDFALGYYWDNPIYRLTSCNCQDFVSAFRQNFE